MIFLTTVSSHWDLCHGKFGLHSPGIGSWDRPALPNLQCMLVCVCVCESTCACWCERKSVYMYVCMCVWMWMLVWVCVCTCWCVCVCVCEHAGVHVCVCVCACWCVCVSVCSVYMYVWMCLFPEFFNRKVSCKRQSLETLSAAWHTKHNTHRLPTLNLYSVFRRKCRKEYDRFGPLYTGMKPWPWNKQKAALELQV